LSKLNTEQITLIIFVTLSKLIIFVKVVECFKKFYKFNVCTIFLVA
jgi:hypothetical protein